MEMMRALAPCWQRLVPGSLAMCHDKLCLIVGRIPWDKNYVANVGASDDDIVWAVFNDGAIEWFRAYAFAHVQAALP